MLIVKVLNQPGMLSDVARVMADSGINIDSIYGHEAGTACSAWTDIRGRDPGGREMTVLTLD